MKIGVFWVHEGIELHDDGLKFIGIGIMPDGDSKNVLTSSEVSIDFSKERIPQKLATCMD
jgi:hypothetical protein